MGGQQKHDELLHKKAAKKKAAVEAAPKVAPKAPSTEQAPPKPFGQRVADQKAAAKPTAKAAANYAVPPGITAGPSEDDRGPVAPLPTAKLDKTRKNRVIGVQVNGASLTVTIAAGFDQGVYEGATGELRTAKGIGKHDFRVWDVRGRFCKATVEHATPDSIRDLDAYFN